MTSLRSARIASRALGLMVSHRRFAAVRLVACAALCSSGCKQSAAQSGGTEVASSLTRAVDFPHATIINTPLPATTEPRATLMPLAPTVVVQPGAASIMALEVDDPEQRDVTATLMQFGDDDSHLRIPVMEGEGHSDVVENDFTVEDTLCKDLCNSIFEVEVKEKAELADGKITKASSRTIVVDCRKKGDPKKCTAKDGSKEPAEDQLCGDVTDGKVALSGDPAIDAYLDAITQLSKVEATAALEARTAFSTIAMSLGLAMDAAPADITTALEMKIANGSDAGLKLLIARPGCALRKEQVSLALRACDPKGPSKLESLSCEGTCEPSGDDASSCASAMSSGCRGALEAEHCKGTCLGACEVKLSDPAPCAGTCVGSCDGDCPNSDSGGCKGPCTGNCTGTCRKLSSESCDGSCTGRCDEPATGEPSCKPPLRAYCSPAMASQLECPGDCFGDVSLDQAEPVCTASVIAAAQIFPRCVDPLVQLSFAFKTGLSSAEQTAFASFVHELNDPLGRLYDALDRISLLKLAVKSLNDAERAEIADQLRNGLDTDPENPGLKCADDLMMTTSSWLDDKQKELDRLDTDANLLASAISVMMQ